MSNGEYWKKRFKMLEEARHKKSFEKYAEMEKVYKRTLNSIETRINAWYGKFADNNKLSLKEAKKLLTKDELKEFKWSLQDYIRYGEENNINGQWVKELRNTSSKFHISRLEALKVDLQQEIEILMGGVRDDISQTIKSQYTDGYYHTAFEIQKGYKIGWDIEGIDSKRLENIINKPWTTDGLTFSNRLWTNQAKLINSVHNALTQQCVVGFDTQKVIDRIAKQFNVSKVQAGRVVNTESAYFGNLAQKDCFEDLDVEMYKIVATLDNITDTECQELDGKTFKMLEYETGVTAPPFHVNCRCCTCPAIDDFGVVGERAARDEKTGKTYRVPGNITYNEWKDSFVDGGSKEEFTDITIDSESLSKLKSAMKDNDFKEYLNVLNDNPNKNIKKLYNNYADKIGKISFIEGGGCYRRGNNSIEFSYPDEKYQQNGRHKFATIAHEFGHFIDAKSNFNNLSFKEIDMINNKIGREILRKTPSTSDEFLKAMRADKEFLRTEFKNIQSELVNTDSSSGVQDALDGMFSAQETHKVKWGHGDKYYNRFYNNQINNKYLKFGKELQSVYKELGFDASNQTKVKRISRSYETTSEMFANIMSAETTQSEALDWVKKCLPNSYECFLKILEGIE